MPSHPPAQRHVIPCPDPGWRVFSDQVMGGVSAGRATVEQVHGREALRLRGRVSLANGGGFVQVVRTLVSGTEPSFDATAWDGIALELAVLAPGPYALHLRTSQTRAPWQFFAASLPDRRGAVQGGWEEVFVPWSAFSPRAMSGSLDPRALRRIGLVAAGAAFEADIALASLAFCTSAAAADASTDG